MQRAETNRRLVEAINYAVNTALAAPRRATTNRRAVAAEAARRAAGAFRVGAKDRHHIAEAVERFLGA